MRKFLFAAALALIAGAPAAFANTCTVSTGACTITNSSSTALVIPQGATVLSIDNESNADSIACAMANGTAAINSAGSYTVPAGATRGWQFTDPNIAQDIIKPGNLNCISAGSTDPATIVTR